MRKLGLAASALLTLSACVSVQEQPMQSVSVRGLHGRELMLTRRDKPDFAAMTPVKAAAGLIGGAAMISAGNDIVSTNDIDDPAASIARRLSDALNQSYGLRLAARETTIDSDDVAHIVKSNADADLLLDMRTINWSFVYFPTSWTKYRVIYSARLRLIDAKLGEVIAEGACARVPEETAASPTYDELLDDNAARLKKELADAAEFCARELATNTLSVTLDSAQPTHAADRPAGAVKLEDLQDLLPRK